MIMLSGCILNNCVYKQRSVLLSALAIELPFLWVNAETHNGSKHQA